MSHEYDDGTAGSEKALKDAGLLCRECGAREFIHKGLCFDCAMLMYGGLSVKEDSTDDSKPAARPKKCMHLVLVDKFCPECEEMKLAAEAQRTGPTSWSYMIDPVTISKAKDITTTPERYVINGLECRKVIEAVTSRYKPEVGFYVGNAIKYLWRAPVKGDMKGDLNKAIDNIRFALEALG